MKLTLIFLTSFFALSSMALQSVYTSVDTSDCVTVDSADLQPEPEIDFYTGECPGMGGYQVIIAGGDIRYDLRLKYNGTELPRFVQNSAFHDMGSKKIEWRYKRNVTSNFQNTVEYKALIFRISFSDMDNNGQPVERSELYVIKLAGMNSCTVGIVPQSTNMNQKAQEISDRADSLPCM